MHWSGAYTIWDKGVTEQWHYYISSKELSAEELLHHARTEWSVESMHWLLDVHFDEDKCRIQSKNIQQNLNMLHKVALNIVRIYKRETQSKLALNGIMFRALMNPHGLLPLLDKNWFPWSWGARKSIFEKMILTVNKECIFRKNCNFFWTFYEYPQRQKLSHDRNNVYLRQ